MSWIEFHVCKSFTLIIFFFSLYYMMLPKEKIANSPLVDRNYAERDCPKVVRHLLAVRSSVVRSLSLPGLPLRTLKDNVTNEIYLDPIGSWCVWCVRECGRVRHRAPPPRRVYRAQLRAQPAHVASPADTPRQTQPDAPPRISTRTTRPHKYTETVSLSELPSAIP